MKTYKRIGTSRSGAPRIKLYINGLAAALYIGYIDKPHYNTMTLYPEMLLRLDSCVPGKHTVSIYKIKG